MSKRKSVEAETLTLEKYEQLTDVEHLLRRPDQYVGQIRKTDIVDWVVNTETNRMEQKTLNVSPAAVKVFDEVLGRFFYIISNNLTKT